MTATKLLVAISIAMLLQLALFAWIAIRRRRAGAAAGATAAVAADAWTGWRDFRIVRRQIEDASGSICSFYLKPCDNGSLPAFQPGQYLTFSVRTDAEGKEQVRCYSLSEYSDAGQYRISVKRVPKSSNPSNRTPVSVYFLDNL